MAQPSDLAWQPTLFDAGSVAFDKGFTGLTRRMLDDEAWVDVVPGWVRGADELFAELLARTPWQQHERWMYEKRVTEPRLTHRWHLDTEQPPLPVLARMAEALGARYGVEFTQLGANLYRDGRDSVAWHGDRVARELPSAVVVLVSLGAARPFRLRPKGGGSSISLLAGRGDLLVLGGSCQRTWEHSVPKVRAAGPRISVQLRHAYQR